MPAARKGLCLALVLRLLCLAPQASLSTSWHEPNDDASFVELASSAFQKLDADSSGCISFSEYLTFAAANSRNLSTSYIPGIQLVPPSSQRRLKSSTDGSSSLERPSELDKSRQQDVAPIALERADRHSQGQAEKAVQPRSLMHLEARSVRADNSEDLSTANRSEVHIGFALALFNPDESASWDTRAWAGAKLAIDDLNRDDTILPNVQLVFSLRDSKCDGSHAVAAALDLYEAGVEAVVGNTCSGATLSSNLLLGYYNIPQISGTASSAELSSPGDSGEDPYPYFMRTMPSDAYQARSIADVAHFYGWSSVATVASQDSYGLTGIEAFHKAAAALGITIAVSLTYDAATEDFSEVVQGLKQSRVYIIVVFGYAEGMGRLMEQAYAARVGGSGFVWLGSESTADPATWETMSEDLTEAERNEIMRGYLGVLPYVNTSTPEYQGFAERWAAQPATVSASGECSDEVDASGAPIWMRYDVDDNLTSYDACIGSNFSRLEEVRAFAAASLYDAVYVVARALHQLLEVDGREEVVGAELREAMLAQFFVGASGTIKFDSLGDRSEGIAYELVNHAGNSSLQRVGLWHTDNGYEECAGEAGCEAVVWSTDDTTVPAHSRYVEVGMLHGLFKLDGEKIDSYAVAAASLAIEDINRDERILPHCRLLMIFRDDKCEEDNSAAFALVAEGAQVVIGTGCSRSSVAAQELLRNYEIPQISGGATSPALSSPEGKGGEDAYPYFMRTSISDYYSGYAMAEVVAHYNWTYVATVAVDDPFGEYGMEAFHNAAATFNITIAAALMFEYGTSDFSEVVQGLLQSRAYIIVVMIFKESIGPLMEQAYAAGVGGEGFVWLNNAPWDAAWETMSESLSEAEKNRIMKGALGITVHLNTSTPEYQGFAERWAAQPATVSASGECSDEVDASGAPIWMRYDVDDNLTSYDACVGLNFTTLGSPASLEGVSATNDAAHVVAMALHQLLYVQNLSSVTGPALNEAMLAQSFVGASGRVAFDSLGDRSEGIGYELLNHNGNMSWQRMGLWDATAGYKECAGEPGCETAVWSLENERPKKSLSSRLGIAMDLGRSALVDRMAAAKLAIDDINRNDAILRDVELVFSLQDSKCDASHAFRAAESLYEADVDVVIGNTCSSATLSSQEVLPARSIPQISGSSSSTELSSAGDSGEDPYPYFMRTMPSDAYQARSIAHVAHFYGWSSVGTVASQDSYGLMGIEAFHKAAAALGITIAVSLTYDAATEDFSEVVQGLKQSRVYIIVVFGYAEGMGRLMEQAYAARVGGSGFVWLGSESTADPATWETMSEDLTEAERNEIMRGYLGVLPYVNTSTPEYQGFAERWVAQPATVSASGECSDEVDASGAPIWMRYDVDDNLTSYDACIGSNFSSLEESAGAGLVVVYDAVYVVARALHQLLEVDGREEVVGAELREAMLAQFFVGASGTIKFDSLGDRSEGIAYELVNHAGNSSLQRVGLWHTDNGYEECAGEAGCEAVVWSTGSEVPQDGVCGPGSVFNVSSCEPCALGSFHDQDNGTCVPCSPGAVSWEVGETSCAWCRDLGKGYYQDASGQSACHDCPLGADCSSGNSVVGEPGYWRESFQQDHFFECYNEALCTGETAPYAGPGCAEGHEGPFCLVCAAGFARAQPFTRDECEACRKDHGSSSYHFWVWFTACLMVALLALTFLYLPFIRHLRASRTPPYLAGAGVKGDCGPRKSAATDDGVPGGHPGVRVAGEMAAVPEVTVQNMETIRAMTIRNQESLWWMVQLGAHFGECVGQAILGFFGLSKELAEELSDIAESGFDGTQTLGKEILASVIAFTQVIGAFRACAVEWPPCLDSVFSVLDFTAWLNINSLDIQCMMKDRGLHYSTMLTLTGAAMVASFFLVMGVLAEACIRSSDSLKVFRMANLKAVIFTLFLSYPIFAARFLQMIPCRTVYGSSYLLHDFSESCDSTEHIRLLAVNVVLGVGLFICGVPIFFMMCMLRFQLPHILREKRLDAQMSNLLTYVAAQPVLDCASKKLPRVKLPDDVIDVIYAHIHDHSSEHSYVQRCRLIHQCCKDAQSHGPTFTTNELFVDEDSGAKMTVMSALEEPERTRVDEQPPDVMEPLHEPSDREAKMTALLAEAIENSHVPRWYHARWTLIHSAKDRLAPYQDLETAAITSIGFLFTAYKPEYWWFEIWETGRKLLFVAFPVIFGDVEPQLCGTMIVCLAYVATLHFLSPNANPLALSVKLLFAYLLLLNSLYAWMIMGGIVNSKDSISSICLAVLNIIAFTIPGIFSLVLMALALPKLLPKSRRNSQRRTDKNRSKGRKSSMTDIDVDVSGE
ncbi:hypothetical protein CYMTET_9652 [Cymbomonas tetramitiformis]|uniref:EF-hand domain-containing protein n=1 Tax=Cymbomonas tetramitiformis TaxID=36881 RepID=A0AAE0LF88_9CHLO|nr:hypothetical protein CYMTET_9652 [Cymbomonas tetramitiformis]